MKFNVVIGNPPYNRGLFKGRKSNKSTSRGYPHLYFAEQMTNDLLADNGCLCFVMPASFMTLASLDKWRKHTLATSSIDRIVIKDNRKQQVFNTEHTWICSLFISKQPYIGTIYNAGDNEFSVDLTEYKFVDNGTQVTTWPMFKNELEMSIYHTVTAKSKPLHRPMGQHDSNKPYIGYIVQGKQDRPCVNAIPMDRTGLQPVKCPAKILFDTVEQAELYCQFMYTNLFTIMLEISKCTSKTQPQSICQIGNFDFKNDNFINHFKLTQEEIDHIENGI